MRKVAWTILALLMAFSLSTAVTAGNSPVLWKGHVCDSVSYQKSIEAVAIGNGTVYAGCSYRQLANSSGLIGIYYLGELTAYNLNGTHLWTNDSGYVIGIHPLDDGSVLVGNMGGFISFDKNGHFISRNLTCNKLYDFRVVGDRVYAVDADFYTEKNVTTYSGHLYIGRIVDDGVVLGKPIANFTSFTSRVRPAEGIIYVGAGFPSGYVGPGIFGYIYGVLPNGTVKWKIETGQWVRDMELLGNDVVAGTGVGKSNGYLYLVDPSGKVLWKRELFYTEDILVKDGRIYVGGMGQNGGVLAALDSSGKVLWKKIFPYRVKVIKYTDGKLLVGVGKFESRNENGTSMVFSVGALYAVDPKSGKTLGELPDIGYVRSIAVKGNMAVVGTASSTFYMVDVDKLTEKNGQKICGPAFLAVLVLIPLLLRRR